MCFLISLVPATFWVTIGYFVLFASSKAQNGVSTFGRILAIWIFVIALFPPIAGAYVTLSDQCPIEQMMQNLQKRSGESS
ncbi:MAG: hypothetical protein ACR2Q4_24530 [Geminicoccaceae bacterium]